MRRHLTAEETERLFLGAIDGALPRGEQAAFDAERAADAALEARYQSYRRAVGLLHDTPREKAPDSLAALILRRSRRRRFALREQDAVGTWRVPAEVVIPLLLAAMVALFMVIASP